MRDFIGQGLLPVVCRDISTTNGYGLFLNDAAVADIRCSENPNWAPLPSSHPCVDFDWRTFVTDTIGALDFDPNAPSELVRVFVREEVCDQFLWLFGGVA